VTAIRGLQTFRHLHACPGCFRLERSPGGACTRWISAALSRRTQKAVIRGTRMTVHSVLGRIEHGETVDDILNENPDLSRKAVEAAITYARTRPLIGRPWAMPSGAVHR